MEFLIVIIIVVLPAIIFRECAVKKNIGGASLIFILTIIGIIYFYHGSGMWDEIMDEFLAVFLGADLVIEIVTGITYMIKYSREENKKSQDDGN